MKLRKHSPTFWLFLVLWLGFGLAVVVTGRAQVTPTAGITTAREPLKRVVNTVVLDSTNGITIAHLKATIGTFGNLTVTGTCTGCGGGSGGGGGGGSTSIDLSTIATLTSHWDASKDVYSDTSCTAVATTGGTIACWKDQVTGLAAKEVSTVKDPIYAWQDRFGHPGVRMNQTPDNQNNGARLTTATTGAPIPAAYTACAIYRLASAYGGIGAGAVFQVFEEADGTPRGMALLLGLAEPDVGTQFRSTINASGTGSLATTPVNYALSNSVVEQCALVNSTKMQTIVNGMASPTLATGASVQDGNVVYVLGNGDYSAVAGPYTLYEVFQYSSVVTGTGLNAIFTYGRQKYGVDDVFGSGSSSSGGGSISDPITVNGWTPGSGTGTVAGSLVTTGSATDTGHTTTGNAHVTGDLTVDGAISGITTVGGAIVFSGQRSVTSVTEIARMVLPRAVTPAVCYWSQMGIGGGFGNCNYQLRLTGGATICSVVQACNASVGTMSSASCSGAAISATTDFSLYETMPIGSSSGTGQLSCGYTTAP